MKNMNPEYIKKDDIDNGIKEILKFADKNGYELRIFSNEIELRTFVYILIRMGLIEIAQIGKEDE